MQFSITYVKIWLTGDECRLEQNPKTRAYIKETCKANLELKTVRSEAEYPVGDLLQQTEDIQKNNMENENKVGGRAKNSVKNRKTFSFV